MAAICHPFHPANIMTWLLALWLQSPGYYTLPELVLKAMSNAVDKSTNLLGLNCAQE